MGKSCAITTSSSVDSVFGIIAVTQFGLLICVWNISAMKPNLASFSSGVSLVHWCRDYVNLPGMDGDLVTPPKIPGVMYQSLEEAESVLLDVTVS